MEGTKIRGVISCLRSNVASMKEGFTHLDKIETDPDLKKLNSGIALMIEGVQTKISRAVKTIDVTDDPTLTRLDSEVEESRLKEFCEAFKKSIAANYPEEERIDDGVRLAWGKWKDKIEYWLESVETTIDTWSELAEGSAMQGVLKILSKAITALAKAISSTK